MCKQAISSNVPQSAELNGFFKTVLWICTIGSLISFLPHFINPVPTEMFISTVALIICVVGFLLFAKRHQFAYHLMLISTCGLYFYITVVEGNVYITVMLFFPFAIIYTFAFFNSLITKIAYLIAFILCQITTVYYLLGGNAAGLSFQSMLEIINIFIINTLTFLLCYFFLKNLYRHKQSLKKATYFNNEQRVLMQQQNEQLRAYINSNIKLGSYAQLAAHELKSPLSLIKGFSQLLTIKLKNNTDDTKKIVGFIASNIDTMTQLIDDFQDLGSIGKKDIEPTQINLHTLINEVKTLKQKSIIQQKAQLIFDGNIETIKGDVGLLLQLFLNLISNALKFVKADKKPIIQIETFTYEGYCTIKIKDNGIGIEPKNRAVVFRIFKRLHKVTVYQGSGIGLSICKKIVELHYGTIWIEDSELGGSCFTIRLPV